MALTIDTQPFLVAFSKNPIIWKFNTDNVNARINIIVKVEEVFNSGTFVPKAELELPQDSNGDASFDIQSILHAALRDVLIHPVLPLYSPNIEEIDDGQRKYLITVTEKIGTPPVDGDTIDSSELRVQHGGISNELYGIDNDYLQNIGISNSLLSWYPDGKLVAPDQREYLAWINYTGANYLSELEVIVYEKNGTVTTVPFTVNTSVKEWRVLLRPVGWDQLSIPINAEDVVKYSVQLMDGLVGVSPQVTYYMDCTYRECRRDLIYLNAFCMPETLLTTGEWNKVLEVDRLQAERILDGGYKATKGQRFQYRSNPDNVWTARSGFYSSEEIEALQQMLISDFVYEELDDRFVPVIIDDKKYNIHECLQFLHSLEFEVRRSFLLNNYSPE